MFICATRWTAASHDQEEQENVIVEKKFQCSLLIDFNYMDMLNMGKQGVSSGDHTIESLIYVLVWICVLYQAPNKIHCDRTIKQTCLKQWALAKMTTDIQALCDQKPLKPTIARLYKLIQSSHDSGDGSILNHAAIMEVLMDAFNTVTEHLQKEPAPTGSQYYSEGPNACCKIMMLIMMNSKPPQCGVQHVFRGPHQGQSHKRMTTMSMRAAPSIDHIHLQVCNSVLVAVLMAKSCTKKHATPQVADELYSALNDLVVGLNTQKKAKVLPSSDNPSDQTCHALRVNKGSGSQIAQLQNIECIQTQAIARVSPVEVATTNEPRNPLAPPSDKQLPQWKTCPLNSRAEEKVPIPGSQYGFCLPSPAADSATSCSDSTVPHCIPASQGGTPTNPKVTMPALPVPLRSSQIVQCAYNSQTRQLSRTLSVHDLNTALQPQNFFDQDVSVPMPLPYYHAGEDSDTECVDDHDSFPSQHGKFPISGDTDIDDISPDEDERTAEAALHTPEPDSRSQGANFHSVHSHMSTLELGQFYHGQDKQHSCPSDSQIDPTLLTISEQQYGEDSDIHQNDCMQFMISNSHLLGSPSQCLVKMLPVV
ncbi:hypothetical protein EDD16DRAFT_1525600 [Pisolithus croceorrhizus]|nr:hypothetical protein EDD16DRAFT_1525600 [Pisolithus croceorrhizus]